MERVQKAWLNTGSFPFLVLWTLSAKLRGRQDKKRRMQCEHCLMATAVVSQGLEAGGDHFEQAWFEAMVHNLDLYPPMLRICMDQSYQGPMSASRPTCLDTLKALMGHLTALSAVRQRGLGGPNRPALLKGLRDAVLQVAAWSPAAEDPVTGALITPPEEVDQVKSEQRRMLTDAMTCLYVLTSIPGEVDFAGSKMELDKEFYRIMFDETEGGAKHLYSVIFDEARLRSMMDDSAPPLMEAILRAYTRHQGGWLGRLSMGSGPDDVLAAHAAETMHTLVAACSAVITLSQPPLFVVAGTSSDTWPSRSSTGRRSIPEWRAVELHAAVWLLPAALAAGDTPCPRGWRGRCSSSHKCCG
ncbi:hypothetical protein WJX72_012396 [[Myrmecia] bisecta]|uniref:Uncharacterized protein n=1 Tax=[Myrmecia] bisecta TaxID=41462 RepID=A0AAW1PH23_9CHLO